MSNNNANNTDSVKEHKLEPRRIWTALKKRILPPTAPDDECGWAAAKLQNAVSVTGSIPDSSFKIPGAGFQIPSHSNLQTAGDSQCKIRDIPVSSSTQEPVIRAAKLLPRQLQFLLQVTPAALESERVCEIPACVTISQSILESATAFGWGTSSLFRLANNPFGIKYGHVAPVLRVVGGWQAPATGRDRSRGEWLTHEYGHFDASAWEISNGHKKFATAQFRRFPNLHEAFRAHAELLRTERYRPAFEVRHDWRQFAARLGPKSSVLDMEHCGYSINPGYSAELITLVDSYQFNDSLVLQEYATGRADTSQLCAAS